MPALAVDEIWSAKKKGVTIIELTQRALDIFQDAEKSNEEKREVLTKLFSKIELHNDSVSVTLTKVAEAIAQNNVATKGIMDREGLANQTNKKAPHNRGINSIKDRVCSEWLGTCLVGGTRSTIV